MLGKPPTAKASRPAVATHAGGDVDSQLAQYGVHMVDLSAQSPGDAGAPLLLSAAVCSLTCGWQGSDGGGSGEQDTPSRQRRASAENELEAITASTADLQQLLQPGACSRPRPPHMASLFNGRLAANVLPGTWSCSGHAHSGLSMSMGNRRRRWRL